MPHVLTPWTQQPPAGVRLNPNHPLTQGLVMCIVNDRELVGGAAGQRVGSLASYNRPTTMGVSSHSAEENNSGVHFALTPDVYAITNQYTLLQFVAPEIITHAAYQTLFSIPYRAAGWASPYQSLGFTRVVNSTNVWALNARSTTTATYNTPQSGAGMLGTTDIGKMLSLGVTRSGTNARFYRDGKQHSTATFPYNEPVGWGERRPGILYTRSHTSVGQGIGGAAPIVCLWSRALSEQEIAQWHANPWQMFRPRAVWRGSAAGYTDDLTTTIASLAGADSVQTYLATATTLIASGASVTSVQAMIEALLTTAVGSGSVTDLATHIEQALTTIQSAATVEDAILSGETLLTTIQSSATAADILQAVETAQTTIVSAATVADVVQMIEALQSVVVSSATVTDSVAGAQGFAETLLTTAVSLTEAREAQLFVDDLHILAVSAVSLTEIAAYIEQVLTAASGTGSVLDVLQGSFVGRYLFIDLARPRSFTDLARPRSFTDLARPRSFTDLARPRRRLQ